MLYITSILIYKKEFISALFLILLLLTSLHALATENPEVDITIAKSNSNDWTVTYKVERPIKRLDFIRNPDQSRLERWQPLSSKFEVYFQNSKEYIAKKDRTEFKAVELSLTPTYKHLSKDYAPFSPFSDGGLLFHSGRFFACVDTCDHEINSWNITLEIPDGEHGIVNGHIFKSSTSWIDTDDGMNIYVGKQKPIESEAFIAIIDVGLPTKIKTSLDEDIPKMMKYFEKKLGKLPYKNKPSLFASYANVKGNSSQGGTLPNQIFMHWNKDNLDTSIQNDKFLNDTLWFFGHEVAHLYQRGKAGLLGDNPNQSWIHEGHADLLAANVLENLYPQSKSYIDSRFKKAKGHCAAGIKEFALVEAANIGKFGYYYTCGFVIHQAIYNKSANQNQTEHSAYTIWNRFRSAIENGAEPGQDTFLTVSDQVTGIEVSKEVLHFIAAKHADAEKVVADLLE